MRFPTTLALPLLASVALAACSGVRLQTADEASRNVYLTGQQMQRDACGRHASPSETLECQRQPQPSYSDFRRERDRLQRDER